MKKRYHLYLGKAGHLTVMSELLTRGWNVAIPEVDVGDDIFVVQADHGTFRRVQVKTSASTPRKHGYSSQFMVPLAQLKNISTVPVHYIFIVRHKNQWINPIVIRQDLLLDHYQNNRIGSEYEGMLNLYCSYGKEKVECSGIDLTKYIADFTDFPMLKEEQYQ